MKKYVEDEKCGTLLDCPSEYAEGIEPRMNVKWIGLTSQPTMFHCEDPAVEASFNPLCLRWMSFVIIQLGFRTRELTPFSFSIVAILFQ